MILISSFDVRAEICKEMRKGRIKIIVDVTIEVTRSGVGKML